ncbi:MAG: TraB/GumN family protein [Brevundimonas sp.]|uniref:TraB/GumN family protein n=1 Tax=Brevundimonas sp. TaxID=1871086 RepID=UPI0027349451|nr:TraB/GumN family protein [Brevundimonas sp.]MDP3377608.1 TraB/GumN family protein [Brevundimonas sp.]
MMLLARNVWGGAMARASVVVAACVLVALVAPPSVRAQDSETTVDEIIVTARRSGAPMWEVTRGGSTVLLVGAIQAVPAGIDWRPDALEQATRQAQRVYFPQRISASPADLFRVIWRSRTLTRMPEGRTTADYLSPEWQARLDALETTYGKDWSRDSFLILSSELLSDRLGLRDRGNQEVGEVVRRAARRGRVPVTSIGSVRGDAVIDDLLARPPESWVPCIEATIAATEAGRPAVEARGQAWTRFDVPSVMASPIEAAMSRCWPWSDPTLGTLLRGQWISAVEGALREPGVTLAVAPLRVLAEPGGVLDDLERRGFEIIGPDWRTDQGED